MNTTILNRLARFACLLGLLIGAAPPSKGAELSSLTPAGRAQILGHPSTAFAGSATADLTVVEYLDFNCPYCRKQAQSLNAFLAADGHARALFKDWPIFGGVSAYAARVTIAAGMQGRSLQTHDILIDAPGRLTSEAQIRGLLTAAGVDLARLDHDMTHRAEEIDAVLARNDAEARALGLQGTPGLVVGPFLVPGALGVDDLKSLAAAARSAATRSPPRS